MLKKTSECITRVLAVLLAAAICFGSSAITFATGSASELEISESKAPEISSDEISEISGSEAPENQENQQQENKEEKPKITSGSCGNNLSWNFSAGTLTITGSGEMKNYSEGNLAPWHDLREEIVRVSLPSGLTSVGSLAFYQCKNITAVSIPESVERIGQYAFAYCRAIKILNLGSGIRNIEEGAFSECISVVSISLPGSLRSIGMKAFYRCETITSVTVPGSVTNIGLSAFGYCKNLVSATINANISVLAEYMFYGCKKLSSVKLPSTLRNVGEYCFEECGNLTNVYYSGESISPSELEEVVGAAVSEEKSSDKSIGGITIDNGDGTVTTENTTVKETDNTTVSTTVKTDYTVVTPEEPTEETEGETIPEVSEGDSNVDVSVSIKDEQGWSEVIEETESIIKNYGNNADGSERHIGISLYLSGNATIDGGFIEAIAGKNVTVTVMTSDGSIWKINGKNVNTAELSGEYNLAYVLEAVPPEVCADFGVSTAFVLKFLAPAQINAEVLIHIGTPFGRQNATLFQKNKELDRLQSVVVDNEGYAHFYLGSVSEKTEYYIAMNLPDAAGEALIPENMLAEYGNPEYIEPIKYEITGRTSSWGMNLGQVMGILGGVMAGVIILVGGIMFIWNRQRLKNGYVPKFDDEE